MENGESPQVQKVQPQASQSEKTKKLIFIFFNFVLLGIIGAGLFWLFTQAPASIATEGGGSDVAWYAWFLFSFAAGLSMIVLPCTLPLVFVIVPMSMGKGYTKGLLTAIMFG